MSTDAITEANSILARLSTLAGGRILDGMPDDATVARDATLSTKPFIVVEFGELVVTYASRSIMDEDAQPYVMPVTITIVGKTAALCRETAGPVRSLLLGWSPNEGNATNMRLSGGGQYAQRDSSGVPSLFRRVIFAETTVNMSTTVAPISA